MGCNDLHHSVCSCLFISKLCAACNNLLGLQAQRAASGAWEKVTKNRHHANQIKTHQQHAANSTSYRCFSLFHHFKACIVVVIRYSYVYVLNTTLDKANRASLRFLSPLGRSWWAFQCASHEWILAHESCTVTLLRILIDRIKRKYDLVSLIHFNVTLKYDQITWRMTHRKATLIKWFIKLNYTWLWFHMNSLSNGFEHQMFTSSIPSLDRHPAARAANPYHGMAPQPKDLDDQEIANAWRFEVWSLEHRRMPTHCSWSIVYVSDLW